MRQGECASTPQRYQRILVEADKRIGQAATTKNVSGCWVRGSTPRGFRCLRLGSRRVGLPWPLRPQELKLVRATLKFPFPEGSSSPRTAHNQACTRCSGRRSSQEFLERHQSPWPDWHDALSRSDAALENGKRLWMSRGSTILGPRAKQPYGFFASESEASLS